MQFTLSSVISSDLIDCTLSLSWNTTSISSFAVGMAAKKRGGDEHYFFPDVSGFVWLPLFIFSHGIQHPSL